MKYSISHFAIFSFCCLVLSFEGNAQIDAISRAAKGLSFRPIGPAMMGGRIADIAVNPDNSSNWYIAVGSGGVWKTNNSGTTWVPIFDRQGSYSIGTVTIDPVNTNTIWVGTGENVSGRHVGWGDGVYKSTDAGKTWVNMGLHDAEHIGKILIDPRDNQTIYVASEGPLWSSGGQRGLYKSDDGGVNWQLALEIDENTGITDLEFDPSNPDVLYAAAYERRRKTWSLLAGGINSGIYKSTDKGATWKKVSTGLPGGEMGKIGLAVTPADPDLVYATIEANNGSQGFYKSTDKAESWTKMNSYISGGTGPHYYQEIEASPVDADLVYQMDVFLHVTRNGGEDFDYLTTGRDKHSDNHALWIDPANGQHLLAGCDGGLYESFDQGKTWRFFENLPIAQFYKIGLDNALPFYNIVAGAQDLGTLIGPSRTMHTEGVRNQDWYVPLGADGYDSHFDPEDPNTAYIEIQGGELYRLDRTTEELTKIKPSPAAGDPAERFNWDSPIQISAHDHETIYFGSQRLWKSTDRGSSWEPISNDLTTNTNRYELAMIDATPSVDALYDNGAMSLYATLTSIAESSLRKGLLYTGSDDGMLYVTEDDGANWREMSKLPDVPERSFINDIEPSQHDENTLFVAADAHKHGNYRPFLFKSLDRGKKWKSIVGDLPEETIVWSIKQDAIDKDLLFIGTEYGVYFSPNAGENWVKLNNGAPNIAFRDIELHPRENDLVGATFGRGIYVIDDYSPLRGLSDIVKAGINTTLPVRDAWWYIPSVPYQAEGMPSQGTASFRTANPSFGALINYYISDIPQMKKEQRKAAESQIEEGESIPFPGWERLKEESQEDAPSVLVLINDQKGEAVRWLQGSNRKGLNRLTWDLRMPAMDPISFYEPDFVPPWAGSAQGPLVAPGKYSAQVYLLASGTLTAQGEAQDFEVKPIPEIANRNDFRSLVAFRQEASELSRRISIEGRRLNEAAEKLRYMKAALIQTPKAPNALFGKLKVLGADLNDLREKLYGDGFKGRYNEATSPGVSGRLGNALYGSSQTTQAPTKTQRKDFEMAITGFDAFLLKTRGFFDQLTALETELQQAGAPYTPGRKGEQ